jgi:23S rRNA (adenine-N6)-dimethyltransferase
VVEVGAGAGILTTALAGTGARVVALELDAALATALATRFASTPQVSVLHSDALRYEWPSEPFSVVANLPFAGSGELLRRLLDPRTALVRADVILQWEAAEKLTRVWPATLRTTLWQAWFELRLAARLDRTAFTPRPAVDAGVLSVTRRTTPLVALDDRARYARFVGSAFEARSALRSPRWPELSARDVKRLAPVLGFSPEARARDLDPAQWARLFAFAHQRGRA